MRVTFRPLGDAAIERYLRAEEPYDCAGSAKSEGLGIALLEAIDSDDPTALVGLPLDPHLPACCARQASTCYERPSDDGTPADKILGRLYLVPAPLDFGCDVQAPLQDVLPLGTLRPAARHHALDLRERQDRRAPT